MVEQVLVSFWDVFAVLAFGVVSASITHRAGIFNVAVEGQILSASVALATILMACGSLAGAIICALAVSVIVGIVVWLSVVGLGSDEVVLGLGLNLLLFGLALVVMKELSGDTAISLMSVRGIGGTRRGLTMALVLVLGMAVFFLRFSQLGKWLEAIRYDWEAARNADIPVSGSILSAIVVSSLAAGLGGCYLAVSLSGAGRTHWDLGLGFVALGLVVAADGAFAVALVGAGVFAAAKVLGLSQAEGSLRPAFELVPYAAVILWFIAIAILRKRLGTGKDRGAGQLEEVKGVGEKAP